MDFVWASDFSYKYFEKILLAVKSNYELCLFSNAPVALNRMGMPKCFLRHDVDVSLKRALKMAEIERKIGVRSTYYVMINSPFYSLKDKMSHGILVELIGMGCEIGLHFDLEDEERNDNFEIDLIEKKFCSACNQLERVIDLPVESISFHRPIPLLLRGSLMLYGRVNAYAKELMHWYLSDSQGAWREGEPLPNLEKPVKPVLQLLIHPMWWGEKHMCPEDRLQELFDAEINGQSSYNIEQFNIALAKLIGVCCKGFDNNLRIGEE